MSSRISRREFLKGAAAAGAGICGASILPSSGHAADAQAKCRIVVVSSPKVIIDAGTDPKARVSASALTIGSSDPSISQAILNSMISRGIRTFTGTKSDAEAWKKLFKPSDIVGIKVNSFCGKGASTHPEVVAPVIVGLKLAGVKDENIIVWEWLDRHLISGGFRINRADGPFLCYGTEDDFEEQPTTVGGFSGRLSKILTQKITALINIPVLKDHAGAGITCVMKNHYGSIHNPSECHGNNCTPYIAELNSIPAIRDKTRLVICDALKPLANGGPPLNPDYIWPHGTIHVGTDPVALDYLGWQVIDARRKEIGLPSLADAGRPPRWIATAAAMGLGTNDPTRMEIIRKTV